MRVLALSLLLSLTAQAETVTNYCDHEVYVAYAKRAGGGTDGLGEHETGSWAAVDSWGWDKIDGQSQKAAKPGYTHMLLMSNGTFVSSMNKNAKNVMGACFHMTDGFNRRIAVHGRDQRKDSEGGSSKTPVTHCFFKPGQVQIHGVDPKFRWLPFIEFGRNNVDIKGDALCNPAASMKRMTWQEETSDNSLLFYTWRQGRDWAVVRFHNRTDKDEAALYEGEDNDWLTISTFGPDGKSRTLRALGHSERRNKAKDNSTTWYPQAKGSWIY